MPELNSFITDRYRLVSVLGQGGMGIAYRAWDVVAQVPVVIKMPLATDGEKQEAFERFRREANGMATLRHPHIVPVLDEGVDNSGIPFIVIRFLPGGALTDRLRRNEEGTPLPNHPASLHDWLPRIASALDFMHSMGVVHRDVKPGNIFFDARNQAFLGDFGIAKVFDPSAGVEKALTLTATNMAVGSQAYMAPELFQPKPVLAGTVDQYALAITVYEALSGTRPFKGESAHIVVEHLTLPPQPLRTVLPQLPAPVSEAVHRALAKNSQDRFPTCADFADSVLRHVPSRSGTAGAAWVMCPSCRRILKLTEAIAGKVGKCNRCTAALRVAKDLESVWLIGEDNIAATGDTGNAQTLSSVTSKSSPSMHMPQRRTGLVRSIGTTLWNWKYVLVTLTCAASLVATVLYLSFPGLLSSNIGKGSTAAVDLSPSPEDTIPPPATPQPLPTTAPTTPPPLASPTSTAVRKLSRAGRSAYLRKLLWSADGIALHHYLYEREHSPVVDIPIDVSGPSRTRYGVAKQNSAAIIKRDGTVHEIRSRRGTYIGDKLQKQFEPLAHDALQVFSSTSGFAALDNRGGITSWSHDGAYGNFAEVIDGLKGNVIGVTSTDDAFAAIKRDGSVITWGRDSASNSSQVATAIREGVVRVFSTASNFTALKRDGSVVCWGDGYVAKPVNGPLTGIVEVFGNEGALAGLTSDGSIVLFGPAQGYISPYIQSLQALGPLANVKWIYTTRYDFAALLDSGRVVTWGRDNTGDDVPPAARDGVVHIVANDDAFAAIKSNGSVVTWRPRHQGRAAGPREESLGGDSSAVSEKLQSGVESIVATKTAFAALKSDGSVVAWGGGPEGTGGGDTRIVADDLRSGVVDIVANDCAFAAIKENGAVICWGKDSTKRYSDGYVKAALVAWLDSWKVSDEEQRILTQLLSSGCVDVAATGNLFTAMTSQGAVIPWGGSSTLKETTFDTFVVSGRERIASSGVLHLATPLSTGIRTESPIAGIAICHNAARSDLHGTWEYRPDGSPNWLPIASDATNESALSLRLTSQIRFRPNDGFYGTPGGLMITLIPEPSEIEDGKRLNILETRTVGWIAMSTTCPVLRSRGDGLANGESSDESLSASNATPLSDSAVERLGGSCDLRAGDWTGTWIRRPATNTFDCTMTHSIAKCTATYTSVLTFKGGQVEWRRTNSVHSQTGKEPDKTYVGVLSSDGRVVRFKDGPDEYVVTAQGTDLLKPASKRLTNSVGIALQRISAGTFTMGQGDGESDESPHQVTLTKPFYIGINEVTNADWKKVMGNVPSKWTDDQRPVEQVTWEDATEFCRRLSALPAEQMAGRFYRLPTEAEWEYACRAGSKTPWAFGDDPSQFGDYGWCGNNAGNQTHEVGRKKSNAWGLYDMHGNVWEWCSDWYDSHASTKPGAVNPKGPLAGSQRVIRGGCWRLDGPQNCRSANRGEANPSDQKDFLGFRIALDIAAEKNQDSGSIGSKSKPGMSAATPTTFASGEWGWASSLSPGSTVSSIATDSAGNVIVTGAFNETCDFDPSSDSVVRKSEGGTDAFVAKYNPTGQLLWVRSFGGAGNDRAHGVAVDLRDDSVAVGGEFSQAVDFDPGDATCTRTSVGGFDAFALKLDTEGAFLWVGTVGSERSTPFGNSDSREYVAALDINAEGSIYLTGVFNGNATVGFGTGKATLTAAGPQNSFILSVNPNGDLAWAKQFTSTFLNAGGGVKALPSGRIAVRGFFHTLSGGPPDFDTGPATTYGTAHGYADGYLTVLESNGDYTWSASFGTPSEDSTAALAIDGEGFLYLVGQFGGRWGGSIDLDPGAAVAMFPASGQNDDVYVVKLSQDGKYVWGQRIGGAEIDQGRSAAFDGNGRLVIAGSFRGTVDFDPKTKKGGRVLTSVGGSDGFLLTLEPKDGAVAAVQRYGGKGDENIEAAGVLTGCLAFGASGECFVAGTTTAPIHFCQANDTCPAVGALAGTTGFIWYVAEPNDGQQAASASGLPNPDAETPDGIKSEISSLLTLEMLGLDFQKQVHGRFAHLEVKEAGYVNIAHRIPAGKYLFSFQGREPNRGTTDRIINVAMGKAVRDGEEFVFVLSPGGGERRKLKFDAASTAQTIADGSWKKSSAAR